jgi:alkylated DNA repair dioxygenase AlkB
VVDLFSEAMRLEQIRMPGAEVYHLPHLPLDSSPDAICDELIRDTPWRQENITVWGKRYLQPRLVAWYGDRGRTYTYSRTKLDPLPWTDLLNCLRMQVERISAAPFNSVLLIASLSLGAERTFIFKSRKDRNEKLVRLKLVSGSLLVMKGDTQANWKHAINKERRPCGPRVNLTFRQIQPPGRISGA